VKPSPAAATSGRRHTGVSVVVPAYNVVAYIGRCIESLVCQTLEPSRYEIVVVDDGSTDGTSEFLDRVAAEHPDLVRVEHITNSGWPGRPRNVGTELARYDYVFYCDADDWLLPHALETMLAAAAECNADIVVARVVGNRRNVGSALYERGDYCTNWRETPGVFNTLTTQKMFRSDFLRAHDLRFAEGKVRLEDFIFMTRGYLLAERISIIGSRPCYVFERRDDGGQLTNTVAREDDYFRSVETIIDIVLQHTEPGRDQDLALDRVVRSELIGPLSRPGLLRKSEEVRSQALELGQRLLRDRVPQSAVDRLDVITQRRAAAIKAGDRERIERTILAEQDVTASFRCTSATTDAGVLHLTVAVELLRGDEVVHLTRDGDRLYLGGARDDDGNELERTDVTSVFPSTGVHITLRSRDISEAWRVRAEVTPDPLTDGAAPVPLRWTATADIDVTTVAGGRQLREALWDLHVNLSSCGFHRSQRVQVPEGEAAVEPPTIYAGGQRVRPYWTAQGQLSLVVAPRPDPAASNTKPSEKGTMATPKNAVLKRFSRGAWWRRQALKVARRAGLKVTDVGAGSVLLSRSADFDVAPLAKNSSWVVSRRRRGRVVHRERLRQGVVVVSDSAESRTLSSQPLDTDHWLVKAAPMAGLPLGVTPIGSRGWLVARRDSDPMAEIKLENETLQHFAARHVTWLLQRYDVDYVLDVGANTGQYAAGLRRNGYTGPIASFEPVPRFVDELSKLSANDDTWTVHQLALGRTEGVVPIREQRTFSSLLPASDYGKGRFATLRDFAEKEDVVVDVPLRRLDAVLDELLASVHRDDGRPPRIFLKMDTQGFDLEVFGGLGDWLPNVVAMQSEVALLLIYEGMPKMREALDVYEGAGFELSGLYPVTTEPDGRVIEYDCVMVRAAEAP
jgi:FkbM family methyltransferase